MPIERPGFTPSEYGQLPEEHEPSHKFYEKSLEALSQFGQFQERFEGSNKHAIEAAYLVLHRMIAEDLNETLPEGATPMSPGSEEDYKDFQAALDVLQDYINENKQRH